MTRDDGYNPMRWRCDVHGCFNDLCRPRIEEFAEDLPGRISFSDVDGVVEINGHFLFLEFKHPERGSVKTGQRILFEKLTSLSDRVSVLVIKGDAKTMNLSAMQVVRAGKFAEERAISLADVKRGIRSWAKRARATQYATKAT